MTKHWTEDYERVSYKRDDGTDGYYLKRGWDKPFMDEFKAFADDVISRVADEIDYVEDIPGTRQEPPVTCRKEIAVMVKFPLRAGLPTPKTVAEKAERAKADICRQLRDKAAEGFTQFGMLSSLQADEPGMDGKHEPAFQYLIYCEARKCE